MKENKFSIRARLKSFRFAFNGLKIMLTEEHNFRVHLIAAILVAMAGFYFHISSIEWLILILIITLVLVLEIVNSAIEHLADFVSPEKNTLIKKVKDLAAAGVLVAAMAAVIVGVIIFCPYILRLFDH